MSRDGCVALLHGAMDLSAVCGCGHLLYLRYPSVTPERILLAEITNGGK